MVELVCANPSCPREGEPFQRMLKSIAQRERLGQTKHYCLQRCAYDDEGWREEQRRSHDALADPLRAELLRDLAPCGSPACRDPECTVKPGHCHRPGCDQKTPISDRTEARKRHVKGYPKPYCSFDCRARHGQGVTAAVRSGLDELAAYQAAHELTTQKETADFLGVGVGSVIWYEQQEILVPCERRRFSGRGRAIVLYRKTDVRRFAQDWRKAGRGWRDPERKLRWALKRGASFEAAERLRVRAQERNERHAKIRLHTGRTPLNDRRDLLWSLAAEILSKWSVDEQLRRSLFLRQLGLVALDQIDGLLGGADHHGNDWSDDEIARAARNIESLLGAKSVTKYLQDATI